jgi:hypothetical protein
MNGQLYQYYVKGSNYNKILVDTIGDCEVLEKLTDLTTGIADLEESFKKIHMIFNEQLSDTKSDNYECLLEIFTELWCEFRHIKHHIQQNEDSMLELTNYLAEKSSDK